MIFPRLSELRDLSPEDDAFLALDRVATEPWRNATYLRYETELQGLDAAAWTALKGKLIPWPKKNTQRALEPLFNILNESRGYNYLVSRGCTNVRFIPVSKQKTPDLSAELQGRKILCDIKTFNRSCIEIDRISSGGVANDTDELSEKFLSKLKSSLSKAKTQITTYDPDPAAWKIAYVFVNFDNHEYADRFVQQLREFQSANPVADLEFVFDTHPIWG
jgi:hypothetical protein